MDNEWNKQLRERFSDYSVPEPEGLWEGIEQGMSGKSRRKWTPVWWLSGGLAAAAAVALVVLLPRSGEQVFEPMQKEAVSLAEPETQAENTGASETAGLTEPVLADAEPSTNESIFVPAAARRTLLAENVPVFEPATEDPVEEPPVVEELQRTETEMVPEEKPEESVALSDPIEMPAAESIPEMEEVTEKAQSVSLGFYNSAGGQKALEQSQAYGMARTGEYLTRSSYDGDSEGSDLVRMLSANRASTYQARHQAPFRMGVKLAWQMSGHLSLVSGLNWTSLQSEFEESTASTRTLVKQNLGYLGIPLQLEASFNPWNRLWLYAGAGGMVEKGLVATSTTSTYIGSHLEDQLTGRPDMGGLLWSVGASAGAEYRFSPHVGVYFAPGLEYHFDNGADIQSAYTQHPLHWNLALGLKFSFGNH